MTHGSHAHGAGAHRTSMGLDSRKMAFWAFIGSECLLFGSLISTYLIYKGRSKVGPFPHEAVLSSDGKCMRGKLPEEVPTWVYSGGVEAGEQRISVRPLRRACCSART